MTTYCGYIALLGCPNVGKSTLMNTLVGQKLSITSRKPQTTRHRILGIATEGDCQYVFVDTPGLHHGKKKIINKMMNKTALAALKEVDVAVLLVDRSHWEEEDDLLVQVIKDVEVPCILVINKVDKITDKASLLPWIQQLSQKMDFVSVIPASAKTGMNVQELLAEIKPFLPESPHFYAEDQITDRPVKFLCAELVREKIFRLVGDELPYATTVEIESWKEEGDLVRIHALIWVDKESHKRMIIGDKGQKLKEIATQARLDMEKMLDRKVFLQCWCKVKSGWADNENFLKELGHE